MAISRRPRIKQLLSAGACLLLPMSLQGCTNLSSNHINPFVTRFAADGSSLNQQDIQVLNDFTFANKSVCAEEELLLLTTIIEMDFSVQEKDINLK